MEVIIPFLIILAFLLVYRKLSNLDKKNETILKEMEKLNNLVQVFKNSGIKEGNTSSVVGEVVSSETLVHEDIIESEVVNTSEVEIPEIKAAFSQEDLKDEEPSYVNFTSSSYTPEETSDLSEDVEQEEHTPAVAAFESNTYDKVKQEPSESIIEKLLGGNLLAKIGIVTLVLGIGFFVKYAIDQGWINEIGRVAIGLLIGAAIIGVAHKLSEKYNVFSSILTGGGISIFYITVTLAFREYEIFSQPVAFVFLIIITIFSVLLSLLYNRQELAIFSLIGGMLAPMMVSSGNSNYIAMFSYLLILNTGILVVSLKKNWNIVGYVAYLFTSLYIWVWISYEYVSAFRIGAFIFTTLFFVQFYALTLIMHMRENGILKKGRIFMLVLNNMSFAISTLLLLNDDYEDLKGLVLIIIAALNAGVMIMLYRRQNIDKNLIYTIIAIVTSIVTVAVPIQLDGSFITICWAAQSVILFWLWLKSGARLFVISSIILSILSIYSYLLNLYEDYDFTYRLSAIFNSLFITGVTLTAAFGAMSLLVKRHIKSENEKGDLSVSKNKLLFAPKIMFLIFLYLVPFLELNYQLGVSSMDNDKILYYQITNFHFVCLFIYTLLFGTCLVFATRKNITEIKYDIILGSIVIYIFTYPFLIAGLRSDIFESELYPRSYFFVDLIPLPAISYLIYLCVKNIRQVNAQYFKAICIILVLCSLVIISTEVNNLFVSIGIDYEGYYIILRDSQTFGYPIFWGISAMILMIWGLKKKEVFLRKISLVSFLVIIVKFYAYDVWFMSQGGRIVSFVILGVILLLVSFMQQKIKILVKEESVSDSETELQNS